MGEDTAATCVEGAPAVVQALRPGGGVGLGEHPVVLAAGLLGLVDQGDPRARTERGIGGGEPCGPRAYDHYVACHVASVGIGLSEYVRVRVRGL